MSCRPRAETPVSRVCSAGIVPFEHGRGSGDRPASVLREERRGERAPVETRWRLRARGPLRREPSGPSRSVSGGTSGWPAGAKARADPRSARERAPGRPKGRRLGSLRVSCGLFADTGRWRRRASTMTVEVLTATIPALRRGPSGRTGEGPGPRRASVRCGEGGSRSRRGARRGHAPLPTIEARHEAGSRRPTGHVLRRERPRATGTIGRRSSAGVPVRRSVFGRGDRAARPNRAERHDASLCAPFSAAHRDSGRGDVSSGPTRDACRLGQGFGLRSSCDADRSSPSWARPRRSSGARVGVRDRPRESTAAMREASVESVSAQTPCREAGRGSSPGAAARRKATPRWPADRDT